jgi:glutaredoxin
MNHRSALRAALVLAILLAIPAVAATGEEPWIVVFFEEGCPDCAQVEELLEGLTSELPASATVRYDIAEPEALDLLMELAVVYEVETSSVPVVFVGDNVIVGAGRSQEFELRNAIGECTIHGCLSPLSRVPSLVSRASLLRLTLFAVLFALLLWWQTS